MPNQDLILFSVVAGQNIYRNRYTHVITSTKLRLKTNVATDEGNSRNEM